MNDTKKEIVEILVDDIIPNRFQPRLTFDPDALNELANSIKEHGIIQPLVVRKVQDKYEIIAGERRYKAASLLGLSKVPCIVMDLNDNESAEVAVIENIQRKEMSPLEEAKSFKKILDKGYLTQEELAKRMGKSQSSIANKLRLLNLDDVVQEAILNGKISERHARSLLKIENKQEQRNMLNEIITNRLTVRQTDEKIKEKFNIAGDIDNMNNENDVKSIKTEENKDELNIFKEPMKVEAPKVEKNPYEGYKSTPEVNLPPEIVKEENQQTNIISKVEEPPLNQNLDIFKFENQNNNNITNKEDINSILNPSVLSSDTSNIINKEENNTNNTSEINNGFNIDINQIKNNAEDIIKKEESPVNISSLMEGEKPENKFFVDLNVPLEKNLEPLPFRVQSALDSINRRIEEIKMQGTSIRKEEKDLDNSYQVIITIDK